MTSGECRAHLHPLAASHFAQLDHHVGVGRALPGVPHGECGTWGRQAVPLHLAQLDHQVDVGAGLVPARRKGTHEEYPYAAWFGGNAHRGKGKPFPYCARPCGHRGSRKLAL